MKTLQQKLELMDHEQNDGPLSHSKNSLYYETKFQLMSKEIEDLRWQLRDKDNDLKKLREEGDNNSAAHFRRSLSGDNNRADARKQLETVRQEAETLRQRLNQLERDNKMLTGGSIAAGAASLVSLEEVNQQLTSKVSVLERENAGLLEQLERQADSSGGVRHKTANSLEKDNTRLRSELSRLREANPDFGE